MAQTESVHAGEYILRELDDQFCRETGTLISGQNLVAGTVLGKITTGTTATATAYTGNTGNGTMGTITVSAGAKPGNYKLTIAEPGTNVGNFTVEDPDGLFVGQGDVATAFSAGGLAFTLADGSTDFVAGDGFTIAVAAGSGKWTQFDQDAADGSQIAAGILYAAVDATSADTAAVVTVRGTVVKSDALTWPSDIESGEQTAAEAQLAALDIIVR